MNFKPACEAEYDSMRTIKNLFACVITFLKQDGKGRFVKPSNWPKIEHNRYTLTRMMTCARWSHRRRSEAHCETRRALLQAAIAVRLDGPRALEKYLDPYEGKPFSYMPVDHGFRLSSQLADNGTPLSLIVTTH